MGLAVLLETGRSTEERLRYALPALAIFGFVHGIHEWYEMFELLNLLPFQEEAQVVWEVIRITLLVLSFISLALFGSWMFARDQQSRRKALLFPFILVTLWGFGLFVMSYRFSQSEMFTVTDVWTRYILGLPAALAASAGLVFQQREMHRQGMSSFGRDCLWAAIAFFWYGLIGQTFIRPSALFPSTFWNSELFLELFGFPVQLLRAIVAILAAIFIIHFLRLFEVENQNRILGLQEARLQEAKHREALRGDLLRRVVSAQEAERQRIARELHDATGQSLTALGLGLRSISILMRQDISKAEKNLDHLNEMVANSLVELQRLIADLRPSHLDDLGLPATLRWYATEIEKRTSLKVSVFTKGEAAILASELNIAIFRIIQEAMTNAIKHADASEIKIRLEYEPDLVKFSVEDDGCGFDPVRINQSERPSWGIEGMRERVNLLGGYFDLDSRPGLGTRIEVEIPYSSLDDQAHQGNDFPGDNSPSDHRNDSDRFIDGSEEDQKVS